MFNWLRKRYSGSSKVSKKNRYLKKPWLEKPLSKAELIALYSCIRPKHGVNWNTAHREAYGFSQIHAETVILRIAARYLYQELMDKENAQL